MGASYWQHFVPYQEDIDVALQQLRQAVFASGNFYEVDYGEWRTMSEDDIRERLLNMDEALASMMYSDWQQVKRLQEPDTIEKLLEWNREAGTHSILDVTSVSPAPQFGTVSPLSDDQLLEYFGTLHPTRGQVQAWLDKDGISSVRQRWLGLYVIVYDGNSPTEICFAGFSGD